MSTPEIVVFVSTDAGYPLARCCIALLLSQDGELQLPWLSGPSPTYCRERLLAKPLDAAARGRDPARVHAPKAHPLLAEKMRQVRMRAKAGGDG